MGLRGWLATLLIAAISPLAAQPQTGGSFAGWPDGWVKAYQRFENYNAARAEFFPAANLEISPTGQISHGVRLATSPEENLGIDFYNAGRRFLLKAVNGHLSEIGDSVLFPPGTYTAVLQSCGFAGFQDHYPFLWFEIEPLEKDRPGAAANVQVRAIPPPQPAENFWPNERLCKFLDFHIFPDHAPDDIYRRNARVSPNVTLKLTNSGTIQRDKLAPELEKLLRWRIYHNGRLIEKGTAKGVVKYDADRGTGTYQIFVGVEGPNGFLPVSNLLQFPLFPEASGRRTVFPPATNPEKFPDFFLKIFSRDQLDAIQERPHGGTDNRYYNKKAVSLFGVPGNFKSEEDENLFRLWARWSYFLNAKMEGDDEGFVIDKPAPK